MPLRSRITGGQKLIWHLAVMHKIKEVLGEDTDPEACDQIAELLVSDVEEIITANSANDAVTQRAVPPSAVLTRMAEAMKLLYPEAAEYVRVSSEGWRALEIREGWPTDDRRAAFEAGYERALSGASPEGHALYRTEMYEEWLATQEPEQKPEGC